MTGPKDKPVVIIVEDDSELRDTIACYLEADGYEIRQAGDGASMWRQLDDRVDLILVDVNLPGDDGFALVRGLRAQSSVGIIMITGRGDLIDRVVGLEVGADDYMAKPLQLRELSARMKAVLRRAGPPVNDQNANAQAQAASPDVIGFAGWRLDLGRRALLDPNGAEVMITTSEFDILKLLASPPGLPVSRQTIYEAVHNREWSPLDRSVDVHVANLRKKLEADPRNPRLIKSVHGIGYLLVAASDPTVLT